MVPSPLAVGRWRRGKQQLPHRLCSCGGRRPISLDGQRGERQGRLSSHVQGERGDIERQIPCISPGGNRETLLSPSGLIASNAGLMLPVACSFKRVSFEPVVIYILAANQIILTIESASIQVARVVALIHLCGIGPHKMHGHDPSPVV